MSESPVYGLNGLDGPNEVNGGSGGRGPADARSGTAQTAETAEARDNSGRRIALEPPAWDLMPPAETETVRRYRPA